MAFSRLSPVLLGGDFPAERPVRCSGGIEHAFYLAGITGV